MKITSNAAARAAIISLLSGFLGAMLPLMAQAADPCDRTCLEHHVDAYIDAMIAHDPGWLALARNVDYTENGQELRLGDGLWNTVSGRGKYKLYVADTDTGQVGFFGTVIENGTPVLIALRLRIYEQLLSQAETIAARYSAGSPFPNAGETLDKKGQPRPQFLQTVPQSKRMSREDLIRIGNSYFTGLANNTGRNAAPFTDTCDRWENGMQTTNSPGGTPGLDVVGMGCKAQQESGYFSFVTSIRNRRFPIVDRERGLVLAFGFFEHNAKDREIHLANGETIPSVINAPLTFYIAELFQIRDGKIDQIEAVLTTVPYGMRADVWDRP